MRLIGRKEIAVHIHVRIHHWVWVWFYVGVVCGVVALVNILGRNLSPTQVTWVLAIGVLFWLIGGTVCYTLGAVRIEAPSRDSGKIAAARVTPQSEWHYASEFVIPGNRKSLLPPKY